MATVLKAGNVTTGGTFTPDGTGTFDFKTGTGVGTTAMTIDASQNVTVANGLTITGNVVGAIKVATAVPTTLTTFTASISGTTMTVTAVSAGTVNVGKVINGTGVTAGTTVLAQLTGTAGSTGTYTVSVSQTVASTAMTVVGVAFLNIPSTVERITVMFNAVSTNGSSNIQVQLGTGTATYTTTGYAGAGLNSNAGTVGTTNHTTGLVTPAYNGAAGLLVGHAVFTNVSGNIWVGSLNVARTDIASIGVSSTVVTLGALLTCIRVTTVSPGTDQFDAGSINIIYE